MKRFLKDSRIARPMNESKLALGEESPRREPPLNMNRILVHFGMLGGIGKVPFAGGTAATLLAGVPAALVLDRLHGALSLAIVVLICILGTLAAEITIRDLGRQDPGEVVVDELAGYLLTMLWLPATWISLSGGFVLFRLFDIWKPWPVRWADANVKGGWGAMLDDLLAGLMAQFALRLLLTVSG